MRWLVRPVGFTPIKPLALLCMLVVVSAATTGDRAASPGLSSVVARQSSADPIVGTWQSTERQFGHVVTVTARATGGFVGTLTKRALVWRCVPGVGGTIWELRPAGGRKYTGLEFSCNSNNKAHTWELGSDGTSLEQCSGEVCFTFKRLSPPPTASTETSQLKVEALPKELTKPGTRDALQFTVKGGSDSVKAHVTLYQGGTPIDSVVISYKVGGQKRAWNAVFANDLKGPLFFCVWAEDAEGNRSARAPKSSCAWIKFLVPIERVSNGCGGGAEKWNLDVLAQNYLGNEHAYFDFESGLSYTVNFEDACNLHDAGYGGHMVMNKLRGGMLDYRDWSRLEIDLRFRRDLWLLCRSQIPAKAEGAIAKCIEGASHKTANVAAQAGAETLYGIVSEMGDLFYDSDLTKPGHQGDSEKSSRRDKFDFR